MNPREKEQLENHKRFCKEIIAEREALVKEQNEKMENLHRVLQQYGSTKADIYKARQEIDTFNNTKGKRIVELHGKLVKGDCFSRKYNPVK